MLATVAIRNVAERLAMEAERERLRGIAERERMERRLRQSERLESLGQLVGGAAHDFNNLLNVIQGYTDFTAEEIGRRAQADPELAPVLEDIGQVQAAAQQAGRLTRQLLRRTLGEHIDLVIDEEPALWRVKADRGQLEQVLVGNEVAARVGEIRPGIPALFISGYAQPILDTHGIPAPCYDILEKPFTEASLLTRVRCALTRPRQPPRLTSPAPCIPSAPRSDVAFMIVKHLQSVQTADPS
jgi:CheY-like chemotaxis protein